MKSTLLSVSLVVPVAATLSHDVLRQPAVSQELVDRVNNDPTSTWRAATSERFEGMTVEDVVNLCGVKVDNSLIPAPIKTYNASNSVAVASGFDWREKMGDKCPSINRISDQANCGSCWVFGSVEVMESRMCIQSDGAVKHELSKQDVTSCSSSFGNGCDGGQPLAAWRYFQSDGIVSGGAYGDTSTCYPYGKPPCNHHVVDPKYPDCPKDDGTPKCTKSCVDGESWESSKIRNSNAPYSLNGAAAIEQELVQKGPVTVIMNVYQDFPAYTSGVYKPAWPPVILGGHAVAIYGYGEDAGQAYWLVKNSWNEGWGENGWFRIVKGVNAAEIESGISSSQMPVAADVSVQSASVSV